MRWKVDALIETRFDGPADEAKAKKLVQNAIWKLVEGLEQELGNELGTSVTIMGCDPAEEEPA